MLNKMLYLVLILGLIACNNSKTEKTTEADSTATKENLKPSVNPPGTDNISAGAGSITFTIEDTVRNGTASILVQKDKDKLSPGNDYFGMVTANLAKEESFVINFLFSLKPGTYPVVGHSFTREKQVFGGLLGGKKQITKYKVTLDEVTDLGSNNLGGHRWKISGSVDGDLLIPAMGIMKFDKNHPDNITVNKIRFANLTFDDNWEQLIEEGMKKIKSN